MNIQTTRFVSRDQLNEALVARLLAVITEAGRSATPVGLMLAGGSTPLPAYREVARLNPPPAPMLRILYSDDRHVPSSSPQSNYHQSEPLLTALALPDSAILRVRTELPLAQAAQDYETQLAGLLAAGARIPLGLLGLGADGHTASLFGPADLEAARGRLAIGVQRPDGLAGVSATPELFARVEELLFVVSGGGKYDALQGLMRQDPQLTAWAAVRDCPKVALWVDQEAAFSLMA